MYCAIHFVQITNETLLILPENKLKQIQNCAQLWLKTDKQPECTIAEKFLAAQELEGHKYYHQGCYIRFAVNSKVDRALASKRKVRIII